MINFANARKAIVRACGQTKLFYKAKKPTIYIAIGIGCGLGAIVTACVATTKLNDVVDEHKSKADFIKSNTEEHERGKELLPVYLNTAKNLTLMYAPSAALETLSICLIVAAHNELLRRNAALAAAYMAVSESFKKYRERVAEDLGVEKEKEYYYGTKKLVEKAGENTDIPANRAITYIRCLFIFTSSTLILLHDLVLQQTLSNRMVRNMLLALHPIVALWLSVLLSVPYSMRMELYLR